ncbi:hypothetical protein FQN50_006002 [Emmonsiellopsis sp. PD_5]|nr:hypothetical protein FQN50_006002 [Emmonsiellopsis sp. PD_5]
MNNVCTVAWRSPCLGIRSPSTPHAASSALLRTLCSASQSYGVRAMSTGSLRNALYAIRSEPINPSRILHSYLSLRNPPHSRPFTSSPAACLPPPSPKKREDGVRFSSRDLTTNEVSRIFGGKKQLNAHLINRMLRILQERRVTGRIDVDLPADVKEDVSEETITTGLNWLRKRCPMDEDAAILKRFEREEIEEEQRLIRRGLELGLYKPQSGKFDKPVEKEGDVYGKSVLQEVRESNEARAKIEEEKRNREWLEGEARDRKVLQRQLQKNTDLQKYKDSAVIEAQPRADPTQRPFLAWLQQKHIEATARDWDTSKLTKTRRILPSLALTLFVMTLCYAFAQYYTPPARQERLLPDTPPAAATILGIIGANVLIWAMWRVCPPAWRMMNKYFISVPMYPYAASIAGSIFSHQRISHLAGNMLILWFIGTRLHSEIGRGDFLSLYLASGVFASLTSLTAHVLQNKLVVTSLGASGAIAGVVAAWCMIHANDTLTTPFLPTSWQETFSARGSTFLTAIIAFEVFSMVGPFRMLAMDYWSHLGGYAAGAVVGWWLLRAKRERERREKEGREKGWFGGVF